MIDDVLQCGRELDPDVVLFETYVLVGPLAADLLGVPAVHHLVSPRPPTKSSSSPTMPSRRCGAHSGGTFPATPASTVVSRSRSPRLRSKPNRSQPASGSTRPTSPPVTDPGPSSPPVVYVTLSTAFANVYIFRPWSTDWRPSQSRWWSPSVLI